ncbi:MAG: hypothetical protein ABI427_17710, partial [Solirubrobacteraceae bacterium]
MSAVISPASKRGTPRGIRGSNGARRRIRSAHPEPLRLGARPRILVAGAGVAGLESLLGLRALLGDRVEITLLAPDLKFVNRSMSVTQPFTPQRVRGVRIESIALALGARWHRGILDRVESDHRRAVTRDGVSLPYEMLVLALGARPDREWIGREVLTFRGGRDSPD